MDELGGIEGVGTSVEEVGDGEAAGRKLFRENKSSDFCSGAFSAHLLSGRMLFQCIH